MAGVMRWPEDSAEVLCGMACDSVAEFATVEEYAAVFGKVVDRIGYPDGKYFYQVGDRPFSYETRSMDPLSVQWPYYQYRIEALLEGVVIRTGIAVPWHGMRGGARCVQFVWRGFALTAEECLELGIVTGRQE